VPTTPPTITALGTPPSSQDSANFDARADALLGALPTFVTETNAVAVNAYGNAVDAYGNAVAGAASASASAASAVTAAANAAAAAASAGGATWSSGSYSTGTRAISPSNQRLYSRRAPGGASPTDPASDKTNWAPVPIDLPNETISGTSGTLRPNVRHVATNAATCAFALDPMTDGDVIEIAFQNGRLTNTFDIGSMTIKGINGTTATGVITNDVEGLVRLYHDGTYLRSAA
jgi:hypothetical protein